MPLRVAVVVAVVIVFMTPLGRNLMASGAKILSSPPAAVAGLIICIAGLGLAIWARVVMGRNWGMPMTLQRGQELVTGGPYAYVRHPIYAAILVAMLGSALAISLWWLVFFIVNGAQFFFAAKREEQLMLQTFPETYPAYMRQTRMLIPFVF